jgi:hypothetical protein
LLPRIVSGPSNRPPDDDKAARSTARPPKEDEQEIDVTAAVRVARNGVPAQISPQATAKIAPFQLAEALARLSAEAGPSSRPPPLSKEEDNGATNVPTPFVELVPDQLSALLAKGRTPSLPPSTQTGPPAPPDAEVVFKEKDAKAEPPPPAEDAPQEAAKSEPPKEEEDGASAESEPAEAEPAEAEAKPAAPAAPPTRFSPGMLMLIAAGIAMLAYAYVTTNH